MNRGVLHWAELDRRRPAVILSPRERNLRASDVIVVPCTTTLRPLRWHVLLPAGEGGVAVATMVKCEQPMTVPRDVLDATPLGPPLSAARLREIERALLDALGIWLV